MSLEEFLKELSLEKYLEKFINAEIEDIETLKELTEDDFKELEVELGSRKKLLKALKNLDNHRKEVQISSSETYPNNLNPNNMVTYLAHPWEEYVKETHFSVKLHWLIDASETVVRFICALLLAEIKETNDQTIPENIQKKFKENISRPTLGVWLNIVKELSEIKIENINIRNLFSFYNDVLNKDGLFPDNGDEKTSLLKLRNRVAHGGGLSQSQSKIYLDIYESHLITLLESVNNLMNECKLYGVFENRCYLLDGLKPIVVENSTLVSGPFIKINDKNLSLWPLVEFDRIRQTNNDGTIKELSVTPQTYLRVDKLGVQYVPIGVDESYSITNKQEEFENIFGLNKKNENASKVKNYEYTYKDFLVEAKYLKEELIGRVEEIKSIKNWIKNVDAFSDDKCRLIYGGPGLGKSMIMASVVTDISNDSNHHTFYYRFRGGDGRNSKFWFLKLLNDSLCSWDKLKEIYPDEAVKSSNSDALLKDVINRIEKIKDLEPIQKKIGKDSYEDLKPTLRLFIDGLDEITIQDPSMLRVVEFLQKEGVVTVVASRLENAVSNLKELSWIKSFVFKDGFEGLPPMSNNDIRAMLIEGISKSQKKELIKRDENNQDEDIVENDIVKAIEKKANGLPLYIYLLIEDINKNRYSILDIDKLPDGLIKYYSELVDRMGISSIKEYLTKVITLLSLTSEPLDVESISLALVDIDDAKDRENLIKDVIQAAGTLIKQITTSEGTQGYNLYHQSFRDFIRQADEDSKHPLFYTLKDMKKALYIKTAMWKKLPPSNFKNHIFRAGNYYTLEWQKDGVNLVKTRLINLEYLLNRTKSLKVEDLNLLLDEYELIETKIEKEELKKFRIWTSFFREKIHLINKIDEDLWRPYKTVFQLAYEDGEDSPLTKEAERLIKENKIKFDWLKVINREENFTRRGLLKVLEGHSGSIKGVKILEDGRILSYSNDTTLRFWDKDGNILKVLEGHSGFINGVKILEDGRILSYSEDNTLRLWDKDGNILKILEGHSGSIKGVKILEDGRILSYSDDQVPKFFGTDGRVLISSINATLRFWDKDGNILKILEGHSDSINGVKILEDRRILSYSDDKTIRLWDKDGNSLKVLEGHSRPINGVKILEDGRILSYSDDKTFRLWDKEGNILKVLEGHSKSVYGVKILEEGRILSFSKDGTLRLWDSEGNSLKVLEGHSDSIKGAKILADGKILSYSSDKTLRLWNKDGNLLKILKGHSESVCGVKILEERRILSFSEDGTLRLWDNTHRLWDKCGKSLKVLEGHSAWIDGVKILADGRILSYSGDKTLRLWDKDGNILNILEGHSDFIEGVEILEDERILSYSWDYTLRIWDKDGNITNASQMYYKGINREIIDEIEILEDGRIISYSNNNPPRLWNKDGNILNVFKEYNNPVNGVEILEDGRRLSPSNDGTIKLWSEKGYKFNFYCGNGSGYCLKIGKKTSLKNRKFFSYSINGSTIELLDKDENILKVLVGHRDFIKGVEILEDGRIISYSEDYILRLWDSEGNSLNVLEGHSGSINGVEILEDGKIFSYSKDKTIRLWSSEGELIKVFYLPIENIEEFFIKKNKKIIFTGNRFFIYEDFTKMDNIDINEKHLIKQKSLEELIAIEDISNENFAIKIKLARLSNNINQLKQLSNENDINIKLAVFKNPNCSKEIKEKLLEDKAVINSLSMSYDTPVELLEQIADKYYEDSFENLLLNPTVLEKTKKQLKKYKIARKLNIEAISKNEDEEYEEEIKLYLKALEIVEELYSENQNRWADFYTLVLNNLALVYYYNLDEIEKAYEIYKKIETIKIDDKQISNIDLFNTLGSITLRLKFFDEAKIYFKKHFELFDITTIEEVENIYKFIYPFVKYYQALENLNENDKLKELDQLAKESIEILKNRFKNKYNVQMEEVHNSYLGLKDFKDSIYNENYEIFHKLFLKQTN